MSAHVSTTARDIGPSLTISILVAEDHPIVRQGLVLLLGAEVDMTVVGEATTGPDAVVEARRLRPNVVLMDLQMPGMSGSEATRMITTDPGAAADGGGPVKVLVLTCFRDDEAVRSALRAGASGFVLKHAASTELCSAIRRVAAGDAWLDPGVTTTVIAALNSGPDLVRSHGVLERLTPRELKILELMAMGLSNGEIAHHLVLSVATVKTHVSRVIMKTGSRDRTQAVVLAYREGLLSAQPASGARPDVIAR